MGQYYMSILGDAYGLNCKVFDRSVDGESMSRAASLELNCSAFYVPCYKEIWGDMVSTVGVSSTDFTLDGKFLLNHDTRLFIDLDEYKAVSVDKDGWMIYPLPLLTVVGNGKGGGNFSKIDIRFIMQKIVKKNSSRSCAIVLTSPRTALTISTDTNTPLPLTCLKRSTPH